MYLPQDVLSKINLKLSRHKDPGRLDWQKRHGKWEAVEDGRTYVLIYDEVFGHVVAETKQATCQVRR